MPAQQLSPAQLVPACVLLIGCLPYLGLATERTWGMYSNLRTEGGVTNHLLVPATSQIFTFQRDLVAIESADTPDLQDLATREMVVPYAEFRALVSESVARHGGAIGVTYVRAGVRHEVPRVDLDPALSHPTSVWHRKLFRFRPVEATGPRACTV